MKKVITCFLVMTMLLTALPFAVVGTDAAELSPIFDLDLSGYNAASSEPAKGIQDKATDAVTETFTVPANVDIKDESTVGTKTVRALNLSNGSHAGIAAMDADVDKAASGTTMTVESWMKVTGGSHYFLYTNGSHNWQIMVQGGNSSDDTITFIDRLHANVSNGQYTPTASGTYDKWAHYVFTREYKATGCVQTLYVNGVKVTENVLTAITAPQNISNYTMHIGGGIYADGNVCMNGSLATFKVYGEALSQEQVAARYAAEKDDYIKEDEPSEPTDPVDPVDPVDPIDPVDPVAPVEPTAPGLVFSMDLSDGTVKNRVTTGNSSINVGSGTVVTTAVGTETKVLDIGSAGVSVDDDDVKKAAESSYTAAWWAKSDTPQLDGWMASFRTSSGKYGFKTYPNGSAGWLTEREYSDGTAKQARVSIPYSAHADYSDWTHIAITDHYNEATKTGTIVVYVNGAQVGTNTYTGTPYTNHTLHIGQAYAGTAVFKGFIGSFDVYNYALSADEIQTNYNDTKGDFVSKAVDLVSVSPTGGTQDAPVSLEPIAGAFTLNFDNTVSTASESLGAITLAKLTEAGSEPIKVNAAVSGKTVTVSYGSLDELSDYVLTIGADFASSYGVKMGKAYSFYYKTTEKPAMEFLDIDFEGDEYVVGEQPTGDDGLTYMSSGVTGSTDNFKIRQATNGDKYMTYTVSKQETAASSQLLYEFEKPVSGRSLVIEMGIRGYVEGSETTFGTPAREVLRVYGNTTVSVMQLSRDTSKNQVTQATVDGTFASTPDADGFNYLKVIISRDADGGYFFDVYDKNGTGYSRLTPQTGQKLTSISKIMLAHVYPVAENNYENEGVALSYVKGYYIEHPRLDSVNQSELAAASKDIKLYFDKEMDEASLAKGIYTLTDSAQNDVSLSFGSYDAAQGCVTLALPDHLSAGESYTLTAQDVLDTTGIPVAVTDSVSFTIPMGDVIAAETGASVDGNALTALSQLGGDAAALSFSFTPMQGAGETLLVFTQHFDKDGYLKNRSTEQITLTQGMVGKPLTHTIASAAYAEGDYVMFYIWKVSNGSYQPVLTSPYKIIY